MGVVKSRLRFSVISDGGTAVALGMRVCMYVHRYSELPLVNSFASSFLTANMLFNTSHPSF